MSTSTDCFPWWHSNFDGYPDTIIDSGCPIGSDGNATCDPETMRATTEAAFGDSLSLEEYTLARYIQSEVGTNSIEEAVAIAEAAINRAGILGGGINDVLLYRPGSGYGVYGMINGAGTGSGRWASTSQDPSFKAIAIAKLVNSGQSDNFSNNADDQDGPEAWINQGQTALNNYVLKLANSGKYWVGPLPGIDPWHTFLQFTSTSTSPSSPAGQALIQQGQQALSLPRQSPNWSNLSTCSKPILDSIFGGNSTTKAICLLLGIAAGAWIAYRRSEELPVLPWV